MITADVKLMLKKQQYEVVGNHSRVKACHWTKSDLRGEGGCYKQKFYGIQSHRCIQMTPNVHQCNEMCLFCWRYQGYQLTNENPVDPVELIEGAIEAPTLVEEYPDDTPYPSRLVLSWVSGRPLHLVLAGPTGQGHTILVTLYEPDLERWEPGFTRRKPKP